GCWAAGDTTEALRRCERAVTWAKEQGDPRSEIWALFLLCHLFDLLEDWETLAARAPEIESLCARHSISPWQGFGVGMQIWAQANLEKAQDAATDRMGEIMLAQGRASHTSFKSGILFVAARNYAFADVTDEAERIFDETVRFCEASGERVLLPEVFRWQGLLALKRGDSERAAERFATAISIARDHGAPALERRARTSRVEAGLGHAEDEERLAAALPLERQRE
ncbi:MAG: hypothetical protein AB8G23_18645, partial [Myxococcota bacterium]